jgi:dimethylargininase
MSTFFQRAIVRKPCRNIIYGLSSSSGIPNYSKSLIQHSEYSAALRECGPELTTLDADDDFPDSTFIEDVALCTSKCAIITNPGAPSRNGEITGIKQVLYGFYRNIEEIISPGTLEAGDVMMVDDHFFIGISERTNIVGAEQLINILRNYGFTASTIRLRGILHLKSGSSYLENNNLLVTRELAGIKQFESFNRIVVPEHESYAANSLWINGKVLVPQGFPETLALIQNAGYDTLTPDVSEFRKLDGGLSCLSLRF